MVWRLVSLKLQCATGSASVLQDVQLLAGRSPRVRSHDWQVTWWIPGAPRLKFVSKALAKCICGFRAALWLKFVSNAVHPPCGLETNLVYALSWQCILCSIAVRDGVHLCSPRRPDMLSTNLYMSEFDVWQSTVEHPPCGLRRIELAMHSMHSDIGARQAAPFSADQTQ